MSIVHEEWRPLAGRFADLKYEVSDLGRVRSTNTYRPSFFHRIRKQTLGNAGYMILALNRGTAVVNANAHAIVAEAFHGERPLGMQVNHIDGDKLNNRADNLEWVSQVANMAHAMKAGLWNPSDRKGTECPALKGEKNPSARITADDVAGVRKLHRTKALTLKEIGRLFGMGTTHVFKITSRRIWRHVA